MLAAQGTDAMVFPNGVLILAALPAYAPAKGAAAAAKFYATPLTVASFHLAGNDCDWVACVETECLVGTVAPAK